MQSQALDVWMVVENGYTIPDTTLVAGTTERILIESNEKDMYVIQGSLIGSEFVKVMQCISTKAIWDKLKIAYKGDGKVKGAKLQTYRK